MNYLSRYFVNGILILAPVCITLFIVIKVFTLAEDLLGIYLPVQYPGAALATVFFIILFTGWLSTHWMLNGFITLAERILSSIPVIKVIYKSVKQLSSAVLESQQLFRQAVLIPYPHAGVKALGFMMTPLSQPLQEVMADEHVCVFVPMSLNLTAGVNVFVPRKEVILLDVTGESALQYIITGGAIMPTRAEAEPAKPLSPDTL